MLFFLVSDPGRIEIISRAFILVTKYSPPPFIGRFFEQNGCLHLKILKFCLFFSQVVLMAACLEQEARKEELAQELQVERHLVG